MSQVLCFNDVLFGVIPQNSQVWVRGSQIATALQYSSVQRIVELYTRHADEFTDAMTAVVTLPTEGGPQETRIFSLRGCHLLAMFARTPVAKAFRRWVLDVLDKLAEEERARLAEPVGNPDTLPSPLSKRTDPERKQLTAIINTWVDMAPVHYASARAQVNAHFGVASVDALTVAQVKEAIQYVQGRIDALPPSPPTDKESLTVAPAIEPAPEQALAVTTLDAKTYANGKQFFDDVNKLRRNAEGIREALHIFARPGGRSAFLPHEKQMLYDNANEAANVAVTSLNQAIYALRMIYNIRAHVSFSR